MISELIRSYYLNHKRLKAKQPAKHDFFDTVKRSFRVGLTDIDFNMHINNANYLRFMERSRWDHPVQTGTFQTMMENKLNFIVAGIEISYIREIRLFTRFDVETRYIGWDDKYFYMEQRLTVDGKIHAYAVVKAVFVQSGTVQTPIQTMKYITTHGTPEVLPEHIEHWKNMALAKRQYTS